jgi:hypothetical protein
MLPIDAESIGNQRLCEERMVFLFFPCSVSIFGIGLLISRIVSIITRRHTARRLPGTW